METERNDTRINVERRLGMTDRERQQELEAMYAEEAEPLGRGQNEGSDDEGEDKIYNPLKLPLAWDGKPIPFWLYKLVGPLADIAIMSLDFEELTNSISVYHSIRT